MKLPMDLLQESYRKPQVILCQTNKDKICPLNTTDLNGTFKFNNYSEISFNVASVYSDIITGEEKKTPYYDYIEGLRLVYLEGFGYFQLQDPEIYSDGIQEYKQINAYSLEYSLSQRYLETFIINQGDAGDSVGSIDGVIFYNPSDSEHSLLHLVLQKAYGWSIGHVDADLQKQSRSFEVDRESIYDFMMNEIADTFKCYFEFDTINNLVNVYSEDAIDRAVGDGNTKTFKLANPLSSSSTITINGHLTSQYKYDTTNQSITFTVAPAQGDIIEISDEYTHKYDTDVFVTFDNLSNEMKVNYSADDIKTVLTVKGEDDLDIRSVNFGLPSIMNLDYYCTPEWMGQQLYNEYLLYMDKQDKYMSGFYTKDISSSTEDQFTIETIKENFQVGSSQTLTVESTNELLNINGDISSFDINKKRIECNVDATIDRYEVNSYKETFTEPSLQIENITCQDPDIDNIIVQEVETTFTYDGTTRVFSLPDEIVFDSNSTITVNKQQLTSMEYTYNRTRRTITINKALKKDDEIVITTCEHSFAIESILDDISTVAVNKKVLSTSEYTFSDGTLNISALLDINDTITITVYVHEFVLENALISGSIVYLNNAKTTDYTYDEATKTLAIPKALTANSELRIETPLGVITNTFKLVNTTKKIESVTVDGVATTRYSLSTDKATLTIQDKSLLNYNSVIVIKLIDNIFTLSTRKDKVDSVKINNIEISNYVFDGDTVQINDSRLTENSLVAIESIDTHFDLSDYKEQEIVSVLFKNKSISYNFDKSSGILTVEVNLSAGDQLIVNMVSNKFTLIRNKDRLLSVMIDGSILDSTDYSLNDTTSVLTITDLTSLFEGTQIVVEMIDNYFVLENPKDKVVSVTLDGNILPKNEFSYEDKKLTITSRDLTATSSAIVESVGIYFTITNMQGNLDSVYIDGVKTTEYDYNTTSHVLTINDNNLLANSIIVVNSIDNNFTISNTQYNVVSVTVNGMNVNYTRTNNTITITDKLHMNDTVTIELLDNHFTLSNSLGSRYSIEKTASGSTTSETLQKDKEYSYDAKTNVLTVYVSLSNGDKISVKTIESTNVLLIVDSNAQSGEVLLSDVAPTLNSYTPKAGDYVVKVDSYTELLEQLYDLIDKKLDAENTVPTEYRITEIRLNPDNFEHPDLYLPEASVSHLGDVYKIINQDKVVDASGGVTYNDISCKYYVCQMKYSIEKDNEGKNVSVYSYIWKNRDIAFGDKGINALKEKIDVYASINDVQIAAEWDQKDKDSEEYKSYVVNIDKLQDAKNELKVKEAEVEEISNQIAEVQNKISQISEELSVEKNFSPDSLYRLSLFLREDEYTDDCFCVTDVDTDLDKINTQKELLVAGQKELRKISHPTLSFSASMKNLYAMPEFEPILNQFKLGSFVRVQLRPDFVKKTRLLEIQFNFEDFSDFSCTFGDLISMKDQGDIHADLLAQAVNAGKAVASGSSYWQKGYDVATAIDEKIKQGLIDATTSIKSNSAGQDVSWDNYGIHLRKMVDGILDSREGWITNNKFLYSDDNFKTTQSLFGEYTIDGETYWGVLAGCVTAGLIEGSRIVGGEIRIGEQNDGSYAFKVDPDGTVTMNKGDAAEKLAYFSFDGNDGLIVGGNKGSNQDYFCRVSPDKIEFCRKAIITTVWSKPTRMYSNCDYVLYKHQEGSTMYYDYYKNSEITTTGSYQRSIDKDFDDPRVKFGITITYFANSTAYMKQAEIENNLSVGTEVSTPFISLGNFKLQIEENGSLSIISTS